ncbi:MAG: fimbrillin family protein [Muribaculaceae bacterium]|nr:fimbrillin family protein [Muribaculaceae bacterium]
MKKTIFASIAVAMLTACSNDEIVLKNNEANAIRFGVTAENNSRAADVYCNANLPQKFYVSAAHSNKFYIQGDEIGFNSSTGKWENNSGLRYWPNEGPVTFYGYVNDGAKFTWSEATAAPTFANFVVNGTVADQVDLLYARKTQEKQNPTGGAAVTTPQQVNLNFRHALSQIVFNAKNTNPNLYVEIEGVSVVNVNGKGTYTFPSVDTDNNIDCDEAVDNDATYQKSTRGTWSELSENTNYSVTFAPVALTGSKTATPVSLTTANDEGKKFNGQAMLLLPQTTEQYNVEVASTEKDENGNYIRTGSYFLVKCRSWNVAGSTVVKEGENADVVLWGENGAANVLLPVKFEWLEGKKYTYTFVFGNGNGGYDPDPEDPDPDPVLVPITFDVKVDEFIPVNATEIETGVLE